MRLTITELKNRVSQYGIICHDNKWRPYELLEYTNTHAPAVIKCPKYGVFKVNALRALWIENSGHPKSRQERIRQTSLKHFGVDHPLKSKEVRAKREQTCLKKYGVRHPIQNQAIKEKTKKTCIKKYGYASPFQSPMVKKRIEDTCLKKYGTKYVTQADEFKKKLKQIFMAKYGVTNPLAVKEIQEKIKKTVFNHYGVEHPAQSIEVLTKMKQTSYERYGTDNYTKTEEYRKRVTARHNNLKENPSLYKEYLNKVHASFKKTYHSKKGYRTSKVEEDIRKWLLEITGDSWLPNRTLCFPKHLDMYEEKYNVAIEYNSLMWHNEHSLTPRGKMYHRDKFRACKEQGIQLIQVWDYMWIKREKQIKNHIKSILGVTKYKIHARKTEFKEISKPISDLFLEENHIQGKNNLDDYRFGLFLDKQLVAIITFGRHHRKSKAMVLNRLCFKEDHQVVGGASKLFKNALKYLPKNTPIVSWSENNWSHGKIYKTLGFSYEKELPPTCAYTNGKYTVYSLQSQQKHRTGCPKNVSQHEWAIRNGLSRFWDSGKVRWVYSGHN